MNLYKKLARKYRPTNLDELFGQDSLVTQLKGMFRKKRITNAFLISGATGCGKTTIGRIIHRYVNCTDFDEKRLLPCGVCASCTSEFNSDLVEINGSNDRGIGPIRELIQQLTICPQGSYRVFVIDEAHSLTGPAWEALLKPLEETPDQTIIVICTTNPEKIPITILGRCTQLQVNTVKKDDGVALLSWICAEEELDTSIYSEELLALIVDFSKGHIRNALNSLEDVRNFIDGRNKKVVTNDEIKELLKEVSETVLRTPEWQLALKYLLTIYLGKYTGALRVVEAVDNYDNFIKSLLEYHTQTIYWLLSTDLLNQRTYGWYYTALTKHLGNLSEKLHSGNDQGIKFLRKLSKTSEILTKTAFDLRQYLVDSRHILISTTVSLSTLFGEE